MLTINEFMRWKSIESQVTRLTKDLIEMNINPVYVFNAIFEEGCDAATLFKEFAPMGQIGQPQQPQGTAPLNLNPQQMQQMSTVIGNFVKQKTGNPGFDNAINNLNQQMKLMQQKKPGQAPQPTVPNPQVGQQQPQQQ